MSALTDRILAEHRWVNFRSDSQAWACECGTSGVGVMRDRMGAWTEHIAEVTEAAVRADLTSLSIEEAEASSLHARIDREGQRVSEVDQRCDAAINRVNERIDVLAEDVGLLEHAEFQGQIAGLRRRLDALENAPSVAVEPRTPAPDGEGMPETAETISGAREAGSPTGLGVLGAEVTAAEMDAMPTGSRVRNAGGTTLRKHEDGYWHPLGRHGKPCAKECAQSDDGEIALAYYGPLYVLHDLFIKWQGLPLGRCRCGWVEVIGEDYSAHIAAVKASLAESKPTRNEGQGHRHTRLTDGPDNGDITKPTPEQVRAAVERINAGGEAGEREVYGSPGDVLTVEQLEMLPVGAKVCTNPNAPLASEWAKVPGEQTPHGFCYWQHWSATGPGFDSYGLFNSMDTRTITLVSLPDPDEDEPEPEPVEWISPEEAAITAWDDMPKSVLCPPCFGEMHEKATGKRTAWVLNPWEPEHQCRPQVISREEAEELPVGAVVQVPEHDGIYRRCAGNHWQRMGHEGHRWGVGAEAIIRLLWHPEWGQS